MRPKSEGTKKLFNEIEAWVEIYRIDDVRGGGCGEVCVVVGGNGRGGERD